MPETLASDDGLALLTLHAAHEIDLRLAGSHVDRPSVLDKLGQHLTLAAGVNNESSTAFSCSDPMTTEVFAKAVEEASTKAVTDTKILSDELRRIIDPLVEGRDPSRDELSLVKVFCLALHRSMMAQAMPSVPDWEFAEGGYHFAR